MGHPGALQLPQFESRLRPPIGEMSAKGPSRSPRKRVKDLANKCMNDYESVLTRAVAKLPGASSAATRRAIYNRAREAMLTRLRALDPPLPESDITREENALNQAIVLVEARFDGTKAV